MLAEQKEILIFDDSLSAVDTDTEDQILSNLKKRRQDKTTIMMVLNHKPGALYKVLARLYVLGINVLKLESRPIPDKDFEFMFYFDLETSIYSEEFVQLMCELDDLCEEFKYLGSYSEVV